MTDTDFKPVVYLLQGCPFCMKLRVFLLEAGVIDQVEIRLLAQDSDALRHARETLAMHLPKVGFPTVETSPGQYLAESDAIIDWFATRASIDVSTLLTFQDFVGGMFAGHVALFRENMTLKQQLA